MAAPPSSASGQQQQGLAPPASAPAGAAPPTGQQQKSDLSPILNLESIRTRTNDLFKAIASIIQAFQTIPQHRWSEVLGQFSMVNVELHNLVEDVKPILKVFVAHPKNVNAENAPILPIMLSSKLLPEMELEESSLKEQILAGVSNLPLQMQTERLQKQIETVKKACEYAEKVLADNRKLYGLGSRQVPAIIPPPDKAQTAKIAEQEKLLRGAVNVGEGLRLLPSDRQQPVSLPPHLVTALQSADGGSLILPNAGMPKGLPLAQPSTIGALTGTPQQVAAAQLLGRSAASPMPMIGGPALEGASASPMQYTNSPRSGSSMITDASPQQHNQSLLQRQKVQQLQMQKQQQQQQIQQHQLRQPATPPLGQGQFQQLHQQQQHAQLQQIHHERHSLQMQFQMQQQLQGNTLQQGQPPQQGMGQNQLAQAAGQAKSHLGQMASNPTSALFGNTQLPSNVMANLSQSIQPQTSILQQRLHLGMGMGAAGQQRTLPTQIIPDSMYNMGLPGSQNTTNMGLPLQQQLGSQSNYNLLNPNQNLNFGQQRPQPPSQ